MKKALIIGINEYKDNKLTGCVNDAKEIGKILKFNEDQSKNFDEKILLDKYATKENIYNEINNLYANDDETLLYFSGHGYDNQEDGAILCYDNQELRFAELMEIIGKAHTKYNVIILDCCYSGRIGINHYLGDKTVLPENTVILTSCRANEIALDDNYSDHSVFSSLLIGAINGGAANLLGGITPASVYSYIDQALGPWEQRPFFKANVSAFLSLRNSKPRITLEDLKKGMMEFDDKDFCFKLDPSYEDTNYKGCKEHKPVKPYCKEKNVKKMKIFQKMNQNGLVVPCSDNFMYFAAMNSNKIKLTELGKHYWNLCMNDKI